MSAHVQPTIRQVQHFRHREDPVITHFGETAITTPQDILTLIIRTDAHFATRDLKNFYSLSGTECTAHSGTKAALGCFNGIVETAYQNWGREIVSALASHLDYEGRYNLAHPTNHGTHVHFHSADSLAGSVIRKARSLLKENHGKEQDALFISLDDMIHKDVFEASATKGKFSEIGFSRLFSKEGKELDFVGRPGRTAIDAQIESVRQQLKEMRGDSADRVPIVLLEDNVRRAKTLLWIFNKMEQGGIFKEGRLVGVATCFSVATPEERAKILHEGKEVPLVVGVDYAKSMVDVVTPRDHLFDGFVVQQKDGNYGRPPSFMLQDKKLAELFKISSKVVTKFKKLVIEANMNFCTQVEKATGLVLPLQSFTPGSAIAEVLNVSPSTPMTRILEQVAGSPSSPCYTPVN